MKVLFDKNALKQLKYWKETNNSAIIKKIKTLIFDIQNILLLDLVNPSL